MGNPYCQVPLPFSPALETSNILFCGLGFQLGLFVLFCFILFE